MIRGMDGSWKIDHNEQGELVATHDHGGGTIATAELRRRDDRVEYWLCQCGAEFDRGRGRGERATV